MGYVGLSYSLMHVIIEQSFQVIKMRFFVSRLIIYSIAILSFSCSTQEKEDISDDLTPIADGKEIQLRKVEISYVNVNIATPFRIDCENFDESFGNQVKKVSIVERKNLDTISSKIAKLRLSRKTVNPDVRIKLYLYFSNAVIDTICLDGGRIVELNNGSFADNVALTETILGLYE